MPEELPEEIHWIRNPRKFRQNLNNTAYNTLTVFLAPFVPYEHETRFYLYQRGETYYMQDSRTGKQQSLETKNRHEAQRLLEIKRQTATDSAFNQIILKTCLEYPRCDAT